MIYKTNSGYGVNFNQLVQNGNFTSKANWSTSGGITWSVSDNEAILHITSNSFNFYQGITKTANHKYLVYYKAKANTDFSLLKLNWGNAINSTSLTTAYVEESVIVQNVGGNNNLNFYIYEQSAVTIDIYLKDVCLIDLTQMFGSGNEPATVAEFREMYPDDYYDYTLSQWQWARKGKITSYPTPVIDYPETKIADISGREYPFELPIATMSSLPIGQTIYFHIDEYNCPKTGAFKGFACVRTDTGNWASLYAFTAQSGTDVNGSFVIPAEISHFYVYLDAKPSSDEPAQYCNGLTFSYERMALPIEHHIVGLAKNGIGRIEISGNSYQNGTPTPTSPIPIQSFNGTGDTVKLVGTSGKELQLPNSITLNNQTISLELNKVGTYADKLIIDKASGKVELVRKVKEILVDKNTTKHTYQYPTGSYGFYLYNVLDGSYTRQIALCDYLRSGGTGVYPELWVGVASQTAYFVGIYTNLGVSDAAGFNAWLGDRVIKTIYGSNYPTTTDITNATYQINGTTYNVSDWLNFVDREIEIETDGLAQSNLSVDYEPTLVYNYAKRELPAGFVRLDYIESTGTQWIDTGVKANQDTRAVIDINVVQFNSGNGAIFGARYNANQQNFATLIGGNEFGQYKRLYSGFGSENISTVDLSINTRYSIDKNRNKTYLDGVLIATSSSATFTTPYNATIFALAQISGDPFLSKKLKLYSCKLYDNDTLVRNFIPCYRFSDGIEGLYDTVNKQFYTNQGTGRFIRGNIINGGILNNGN